MFLTRKPNIYLVTIEQVPQNAKGKKNSLKYSKQKLISKEKAMPTHTPAFHCLKAGFCFFFPRGFPGKSLV